MNLLFCSPNSQTKTFCVLSGNASFPVLKSRFHFRIRFVRFRLVLGRCSETRVIQQQPNSYMNRPTSHFMPRNGQGEDVRCSIQVTEDLGSCDVPPPLIYITRVAVFCYSASTSPATLRFLRRSPSINMAGVTTNVSTVATTNPPAMADDSSVHIWVDGAP